VPVHIHSNYIKYIAGRFRKAWPVQLVQQSIDANLIISTTARAGLDERMYVYISIINYSHYQVNGIYVIPTAVLSCFGGVVVALI
jgi:hypothetical protein